VYILQWWSEADMKSLDEALNRSRRRILGDRLLVFSALAGAVFFGGLVLLLLVGTRILDWWVLIVLCAATFAVGSIRALLTLPDSRQVARVLDERCSLADTLATAVYFRDSTLEIAAGQRRQADAMAREIDVARMIPFQFPKPLYALAAFGVIASGLFVYRFGVRRELTLAGPIAPLPVDGLGWAVKSGDKALTARNAARKPSDALPPEGVVNRLGTSTSDNPGEKDAVGSPGKAITTGTQNGKEDPSSTASDGKKSADRRESSDASDPNSAASKQDGEQPPSSRDGSAQSQQAGSKSPGTPNSSGLMSKLRDAVSSLMAKMKPQGNQTPPGGAQSAQQPNGKQPGGQQSSSQKSNQDAKANPSNQEGQDSESQDSDQAAPGKGAGKGNDQNASAKPGSGMGHQDGNKEIKDAEQLNAMGKLSEIIGKRSANVTGEMTIEPQNGPQQLRTAYTNSTAQHGEASGDVNRDEVPVALQSYVQQYFEQVRKQAAVKAKFSNN
jgi:hypothetical protein